MGWGSQKHVSEMAPGWKAGVSKVDITPIVPVYMSGYGNRVEKHDEVLAPIYARALALEDAAGTRAVQISVELLGVSNEMVADVRAAVAGLGVEPAAVRLTATHTHSGPSTTNVYCGCVDCGWITLNRCPETTTREQGKDDIAAYTAWVTPLLIQAAVDALEALQPATLSHGVTTCDIAVNRRNNDEAEVEKMAETDPNFWSQKAELNGPFDHDVELLVARAEGSGAVLGVAFGYACHSTVMGAQSLHGDWPGRAMSTVEAKHPEVVALHINGCSGDQNPLPRRTIPLLEKYGDDMAAAVSAAAMEGPASALRPLTPSETLSCTAVELPLRYHTLPTEAELIRTRDSDDFFAPGMLPTGCTGDGSEVGPRIRVDKVKFTHGLHDIWATTMLEASRKPGGLPQYQPQPYPLSLWSIGSALRWVALGGEVTVGYVERLRAELGGTAQRVWVSAYTNQVQCYIPTQLVRPTPLKNGGDHSFGRRFRPLRNRPPAFWCCFRDSWRRDGENSERTEKD